MFKWLFKVLVQEFIWFLYSFVVLTATMWAIIGLVWLSWWIPRSLGF